MMRAVFYAGRHHVRTAQRDDAGALVTVSTIAARIRREAREAALGSAWLSVEPDVHPFDSTIRRALIGIGVEPERIAAPA